MADPVLDAGVVMCPICLGQRVVFIGTDALDGKAIERECGRCGGQGVVDARGVRTSPVGEVEVGLPFELPKPDPAAQAVVFQFKEETEREIAQAMGIPALFLPDPVETDAQRVPVELSGPDQLCDITTDFTRLPPFCYIAGPAGTGKTFWAKALADSADHGACILAATTGIAAVNLGEGTTINALLKYFDTASLADSYTGSWLEGHFKRLRGAGMRRILLDEVSMLDGNQLTILARAIDNVNQQKLEDDPEIGLILVGDFAQLSPVKAPFAFESAEWDRYAKATYRLTTIRRQADVDFVTALQAARRGDGTAALEFFEPRLQPTTDQHFDGPTLLAKNEAVDKFNQFRIDALKTPQVSFPSQRWGRLRPEWGGPPKLSNTWGIPEAFTTKIGAKVMILANRNIAMPGEWPEYLYVNGNLGTLRSADGQMAIVELDGDKDHPAKEVKVFPVTRNFLVPLEPGRKKQLRAEGKDGLIDGKNEIVGQITYMPLRVAYATTVHKSQGLSLDKVQINIRDHFFSTGGMLYVALSRCRTAEGLRLVGSAEGFKQRCVVNPKVVPWL